LTRVKDRTLDEYIEKMKLHLSKKYPHLQFNVVKRGDREAAIYYSPYSEEEDWPIIHRVGGLATDALVEGGYRIYVLPA